MTTVQFIQAMFHQSPCGFLCVVGGWILIPVLFYSEFIAPWLKQRKIDKQNADVG